MLGICEPVLAGEGRVAMLVLSCHICTVVPTLSCVVKNMNQRMS